MDGIVPKMSRADKRGLEKRCRTLKDEDQKIRYLIILNLAEGRSVANTASALIDSCMANDRAGQSLPLFYRSAVGRPRSLARQGSIDWALWTSI